jgi:hypothetical protein
MDTQQASQSKSPLVRLAGLLLGALAWFADQQIVISRAYTSCSPGINSFALTTAALCAAIALAGLLISWQALRRSRLAEINLLDVDTFVAFLSVLMAVVALLGIGFMTSAVLFLQCER